MNSRQKKILEKMLREQLSYTSKDIASLFDISLRTAQSDLKTIFHYCAENNIKYTYDKKLGYQFLDKYNIELKDTSNETSRIQYILRCFLFSKKPIKVEKIASELFISTTSINKDLQKVKLILSNYDLTLISKPYHGSLVLGKESKKRECIINESLISFHYVNTIKPHIDLNCLNTIGAIVSNVLIINKFNITDNDYQNFLLLAYLSTIRCLSSLYLENDYLINIDFKEAYTVTEEIIKRIAQYYRFKFNESEARFLASALFGKNSLANTEIIPSHIEKHVSNILEVINKTVDIDLSYSIELRVSLSLHLIPLLERINSNNQIQDVPISNIQNDFSFAFELAIISANYIKSITKTELTKAEIAYLAIHFKIILSKDGNKIEKKNILFICSSRRSDSLLIKSAIYSHFSNKIGQIDVKNTYELKDISFNSYDVIFSTILNEKIIPKNAIKINHFLMDADYNAIEFALNFGSIFKMVEPLFSQKRFINHVKSSNKFDILRKMVALSDNIVDKNILLKAVCEREYNGYTSYGNLIALPHPNYLLTEQSFCSVAILEEPIIWSEDNLAQIIILCCASKSNSKDLQMLFNFISLLFNDINRVQSIIQNCSFTNFMNCLKSLQNSN